MIVCPNCNHQNPAGAVQCEACYTPLPALKSCPSCGASIQSDASFCGQCGFDLRSPSSAAVTSPSEATFVPSATVVPAAETISSDSEIDIPDLIPPEPLISPEPIAGSEAESSVVPDATQEPPPLPTTTPAGSPEAANSAEVSSAPEVPNLHSTATQIQTHQATLLHIQTDTAIELPPQLSLIHLGKPNDRVPPTIDVSGFPNSEIVSRVHANIRVEGDVHYIEDVGSSNGTYVNNMPLALGNRHRLRPGDKVALGKGDKVTFIFQLA